MLAAAGALIAAAAGQAAMSWIGHQLTARVQLRKSKQVALNRQSPSEGHRQVKAVPPCRAEQYKRQKSAEGVRFVDEHEYNLTAAEQRLSIDRHCT